MLTAQHISEQHFMHTFRTQMKINFTGFTLCTFSFNKMFIHRQSRSGLPSRQSTEMASCKTLNRFRDLLVSVSRRRLVCYAMCYVFHPQSGPSYLFIHTFAAKPQMHSKSFSNSKYTMLVFTLIHKFSFDI